MRISVHYCEKEIRELNGLPRGGGGGTVNGSSLAYNGHCTRTVSVFFYI